MPRIKIQKAPKLGNLSRAQINRAVKSVSKKRLQPEQQIQIALFEWFCLQYPQYKKCFLHVANERKTSPWQGAILKRMGVQKGVSDIFITVPRGTYHGFWLEVKTEKGRPTKEQLEFIAARKEEGYFADWRKGFDACRELIEWYMGQ